MVFGRISHLGPTTPDNKLSYMLPSIRNVEGCLEEDCPREGGTEITIHGENFGASGGQVRVSMKQCTSIRRSAEFPHHKVMCLLPPGRQEEEIYVVQASGGVNKRPLKVSYAKCPKGK